MAQQLSTRVGLWGVQRVQPSWPPKVMCLKKKLLLNIPTPTQKIKINMINVSISKLKSMFHVSISKLRNTSLVKIISNFDFGG